MAACKRVCAGDTQQIFTPHSSYYAICFSCLRRSLFAVACDKTGWCCKYGVYQCIGNCLLCSKCLETFTFCTKKAFIRCHVSLLSFCGLSPALCRSYQFLLKALPLLCYTGYYAGIADFSREWLCSFGCREQCADGRFQRTSRKRIGAGENDQDAPKHVIGVVQDRGVSILPLRFLCVHFFLVKVSHGIAPSERTKSSL